MTEMKDYVSFNAAHGSINISEEVVAGVVSAAAAEVEGVSALYTSPVREFAEIMGKKGLSKGVKIKIEEDGISADVFVVTDGVTSMAEMGKGVQQAVKSAVEAAIGVSVINVNVHVCGIGK